MNRNFKPEFNYCVKPQWPDSLILAINHAHAIYLASSFLEIRSFLKAMQSALKHSQTMDHPYIMSAYFWTFSDQTTYYDNINSLVNILFYY